MIAIAVNEKGTLKVEIAFTDEDGVSHELASLTSVNWQLSDANGNIINGRDFASNLITASPVVLFGDDLALDNNGICRKFAIKIVYNSSNGTGLTATEELDFVINDLVNIS